MPVTTGRTKLPLVLPAWTIARKRKGTALSFPIEGAFCHEPLFLLRCKRGSACAECVGSVRGTWRGRPGVTALPGSCPPRRPWSARPPTDPGVCVSIARPVKRTHVSFLKQKRARLIWRLPRLLPSGCLSALLGADLPPCLSRCVGPFGGHQRGSQ